MEKVLLVNPPVQISVPDFMVHKGAYVAETDYAVGDVVSYNGSSYVMYVNAAAGTLPTDTTKWSILIDASQYVGTLTDLTITNATTDNTISVDQNGNVGTDVATDGAIHIENTGNTGIGLGAYTNIGATADAPLVSIKAENVAFDQPVVIIDNYGIGTALGVKDGGNYCFQIKADGTTELGINSWIKFNGGQGSIYQNSSLAVAKLHEIIHSGATGVAISIDRDGNSASHVFGMTITVDNAGAGNLVGGIDFSGMSDGEALFKLTSADTDLSSKSPETDAESGWFPVLVGTTVYAVPIYSLA